MLVSGSLRNRASGLHATVDIRSIHDDIDRGDNDHDAVIFCLCRAVEPTRHYWAHCERFRTRVRWLARLHCLRFLLRGIGAHQHHPLHS